MLRSAEVIQEVRNRAAEFGVRGVEPSRISFDLAAAVARKDEIVRGIIDGIYGWVSRSDNLSFIRGRAEFRSPVDIRVDGRKISAAKSILAPGSRAGDVTIPGLREVGFITNHEGLELTELPGSMTIIGAGYIGVEFAQMYARYGTRVTLLSRSSRIMPREEPELSEALAQILVQDGVDLRLGTPAVGAERDQNKRVVVATVEGRQERFESDVILYAAGRVPRVDGLGLSETGVEVGPHGIRADAMLKTTAENIWSLGDVNGGAMFTHRANYDGPISALNAVRDEGRTVDYRVVPRAVFTQPALASVGVTEREATAAGYEVKTAVRTFESSGRAQALGETEGMLKFIADAETGKLLGGHILGPHADILIHEVVVAMHNGGTAEPIARSIHIHPTLSEMVKDTARGLR